ncbi:hypothetical protein Q7P37_006099 [Cladosporium fusiforme]
MAQDRLSHDEFFTQLTGIIEKKQQKGHGSVFLTQKRLTHDPSKPSARAETVPGDPFSDLHPTLSLPILMRASDGETKSKEGIKNKDHVKISTVVQPDDLEAFFVRYAEVCKASMLSLRKRDRKKRKADKGKKKKGAESGEKKG